MNRPLSQSIAGLTLVVVMLTSVIIPLEISETGMGIAYAHAATANPPPASTCSLSYTGFDFTFYDCIWKPFLSAIGSVFLSIGVGLVRFTGYIFDYLLHVVVIAYGSTLSYLGLLDSNGQPGAITIGWTVFRDFTNVLIIGFFVFIAISIILGIKEYGEKRLIANVLVIAILMNFSLLFTKIIIDGSNFVAYKVYQQMAKANESGEAGFNVSTAFLKPMGIGTIFSTYELVDNVATKTNSAVQGLVFGIIGGFMLTAVAAVLLYGCFLIAWRGVLFILLMITAPLAFATYLIPNLAKGEYGWDSWWKMLINNAAFGPLLMILLAISLAIINAAGKKTSIPLGPLISDPSAVTDISAWTAILVYIIGIGMLFVSLKLASSFAGSIGGGFNLARGAAALSLITPLRAVGPLLQRAPVIGARAKLARAHGVEGEMKDELRTQAAIKRQGGQPNFGKYADLAIRKAKLEKKADRTFDPLNTSGGQALAKMLGAPAAATEKSESLVAQAKKIAEHAAKEAAGDALSKDDAKKMAQESVSPTSEDQRGRELAIQQKNHEESIRTLTEIAEGEKRKENLLEELTNAQQQKRSVEDAATQRKIQIEKQYSEVPDTDPNKARAKATRDAEMQREEQRIKDADQKIKAVKERIQYHDAPIEGAKRDLENTKKEIDRYVDAKANEIRGVSSDAAQEAAAGLIRKEVGRFDPQLKAVATEKGRSLTKKKIGVKGLVAQRQADTEALSGAGESTTNA